jgi:hypothetical protein
MTTYNMRLTKILEDGSEVVIAEHKKEAGWYLSPMLDRLAKRIYEPRPKPQLEGEVPLFDYKAKAA